MFDEFEYDQTSIRRTFAALLYLHTITIDSSGCPSHSITSLSLYLSRSPSLSLYIYNTHQPQDRLPGWCCLVAGLRHLQTPRCATTLCSCHVHTPLSTHIFQHMDSTSRLNKCIYPQGMQSPSTSSRGTRSVRFRREQRQRTRRHHRLQGETRYPPLSASHPIMHLCSAFLLTYTDDRCGQYSCTSVRISRRPHRRC